MWGTVLSKCSLAGSLLKVTSTVAEVMSVVHSVGHSMESDSGDTPCAACRPASRMPVFIPTRPSESYDVKTDTHALELQSVSERNVAGISAVRLSEAK